MNANKRQEYADRLILDPNRDLTLSLVSQYTFAELFPDDDIPETPIPYRPTTSPAKKGYYIQSDGQLGLCMDNHVQHFANGLFVRLNGAWRSFLDGKLSERPDEPTGPVLRVTYADLQTPTPVITHAKYKGKLFPIGYASTTRIQLRTRGGGFKWVDSNSVDYFTPRNLIINDPTCFGNECYCGIIPIPDDGEVGDPRRVDFLISQWKKGLNLAKPSLIKTTRENWVQFKLSITHIMKAMEAVPGVFRQPAPDDEQYREHAAINQIETEEVERLGRTLRENYFLSLRRAGILDWGKGIIEPVLYRPDEVPAAAEERLRDLLLNLPLGEATLKLFLYGCELPKERKELIKDWKTSGGIDYALLYACAKGDLFSLTRNEEITKRIYRLFADKKLEYDPGLPRRVCIHKKILRSPAITDTFTLSLTRFESEDGRIASEWYQEGSSESKAIMDWLSSSNAGSWATSAGAGKKRDRKLPEARHFQLEVD